MFSNWEKEIVWANKKSAKKFIESNRGSINHRKVIILHDPESKEEISEAVDKMTLELEQKIKDKARSLYEW